MDDSSWTFIYQFPSAILTLPGFNFVSEFSTPLPAFCDLAKGRSKVFPCKLA